MKPYALVTCLVALGSLLGGCLDDETASVQEDASPYGPGSGEAGAHGEPTVMEGDVDTAMSVPFWRASKEIVITNDFGGATLSQVDAATKNGYVNVVPSEGGDYRVVIHLSAHGMTPQQAEERLASFEVQHTDDLSGGVLSLSTIVDFDDQADFVFFSGPDGGADITVFLPRAPGHDVRAATANGGVEMADLQGPSFTAESSNGRVVFSHLVADALSASTSNGDIDIHGVASRVTAASSNGDIVAAVTSKESGGYALATSNGDVVLAVNGSSAYGYEVSAGTSNGEIVVELDDVVDVEPAGDGHRHVRTADYDDRPIQINAELVSSNGDIVVSDGDVAMDEPHH